MDSRLRVTVVFLAGAAMLTSGCKATPAAGKEQAPHKSPSPAKTAKPSTPSKPAPSAKPRKLRTLKPGAKGEDVRELQEQLKEYNYDPGRADGKYGSSTLMAVWAFQKVNRLDRTSAVGKRFRKALAAPRTPEPLKKDGASDRVEIDLRRQLLHVYEDGALKLTTHISSGSGEMFCTKDKGAKKKRCRVAVTPTGDFRTGRRFAGWEKSPLGQLFNPVYFNGGIAVHGAPSVPLFPASHGCVRIPLHTANLFPKIVETNVPVHVRRPG